MADRLDDIVNGLRYLYDRMRYRYSEPIKLEELVEGVAGKDKIYSISFVPLQNGDYVLDIGTYQTEVETDEFEMMSEELEGESLSEAFKKHSNESLAYVVEKLSKPCVDVNGKKYIIRKEGTGIYFKAHKKDGKEEIYLNYTRPAHLPYRINLFPEKNVTAAYLHAPRNIRHEDFELVKNNFNDIYKWALKTLERFAK